ncbi:MAG: 6-carboxytetrahydropterin synthase [Candidatus Omnitrophica bacterium]|nr:6-carboxytetrahydropterin synthase [Candidatus Omnitrophota bacterium]
MNTRYYVTVEARFESAHNLREYYGEPEPLHGHSWKAEAKLTATQLDHEDISADYVRVKKALDALAAQLDHRYINEIPPFDRVNPTSENIARWFYEGMNKPEILGELALLESVTIWEGPANSITFQPVSSPNPALS